jgi:hypothetical protein
VPTDDAAVGVVVDSHCVPQWLATLIENLRRDPRLSVDVVVAGGASPKLSRTFSLYRRIDARVFGGWRDALAPVDLPDAGSTSEPGPRDRFDLVIDCSATGSAAAGFEPRHGVWRAGHTDPSGNRLDPWLFDALAEQRVYRSYIAVTDGEGRRNAYESFGASDPASLRRVADRAYWKLEAALRRSVTRQVTQSRRGDRAETPAPAEWHAPSQARLGGHLLRMALGLLRRRAMKFLLREEWFVAVARAPADPLEVQAIGAADQLTAPTGRYWADPFPFAKYGHTFLFFESYAYGEGRAQIEYVDLDAASADLDNPSPVIVAPYHLSYPCVFAFGTDIFLIPESEANRTVDLYRAQHFPRKWVRERVILDDVRAVDATVYIAGKRLWLFVNIAPDGASLDDELHLLWADAPEGPWHPHPQNPIVSDARRARPAGRLFMSRSGLIRPSQDCSELYGAAVVLNRVKVLLPEAYEETPIGTVTAQALPGAVRTHTYNVLGDVRAVDGVRRVFRLRPPAAWPSLRERR